MKKCVGSWRQSVQPSSDSSTPLVNCNCRVSGRVESRGRLVEMCGHQAGYTAFGFGSSLHSYGNRWGMLTSATPLSTSLPASEGGVSSTARSRDTPRLSLLMMKVNSFKVDPTALFLRQGARRAWSVWLIAMLDDPGFAPRCEARDFLFSTPVQTGPDRPWGPPSL